uniref:Uncharacterized protein n=1 Tax=Anguilla anguilla TaxID=7936 RepID=A0A0E9UXX7_ANGAN
MKTSATFLQGEAHKRC